jgi:MOSC domain-containing protein YiiM
VSHLESVNAGPAVEVPWGRKKWSAIDKRPVTGPVRVHRLGVGDDEIGDHDDHGGPDQAVYAYAREDLDVWSLKLGRPLRAGEFGENLTTVGLDVQGARLGDRWRIGSVLLEVCGVRIPCSVFEGFVGETQWVRRFVEHGVPGAYLRVVEEGELAAGDAIDVVECRDHDLTVGFALRALTTERHLEERLLEEPRIGSRVRDRIDRHRNPRSDRTSLR